MQPDLSKWEKVKLTVHYVDRGVQGSKSVEMAREAMAQQERDEMVAVADNYRSAGEDEAADQWLLRASEHELPQEAFIQRILEGAQTLATSPLRIPGRTTNSIRILPPWAVKEVEVEGLGVANILTL